MPRAARAPLRARAPIRARRTRRGAGPARGPPSAAAEPRRRQLRRRTARSARRWPPAEPLERVEAVALKELRVEPCECLGARDEVEAERVLAEREQRARLPRE